MIPAINIPAWKIPGTFRYDREKFNRTRQTGSAARSLNQGVPVRHPDIPDYMENDRFAELTGIELHKDREGQPVASLKVEEKHLNGLKTAQGGCIFTLADYAFALASNTEGRMSVALNLSVHFLNAARLGDTLTARTREISRKRLVSVYEITVVNQDDVNIATFVATAYKVGDREPS